MSVNDEFLIGLYAGSGLVCIVSFIIYIMRKYTCEELINNDNLC